MFIINITYKVELYKVDHFLEQHVAFLNEQYELGNFIASGRKVPRTGGIIFSKVESKSKLDKIVRQDPFHQNELAEYELIEFEPSRVCDELKFLVE